MPADYKHSRDQMVKGGTTANIATDGTSQFFPIEGVIGAAPVAINVDLVMNWAGVIFRMISYLTTAPGGVTTRTFTLYLNGAPTALTTTHPTASQTEFDDVNVVAFQRGDRLCWHSDGGAGVPTASRVKASALIRRI